MHLVLHILCLFLIIYISYLVSRDDDVSHATNILEGVRRKARATARLIVGT
jgi:hypothetical protein